MFLREGHALHREPWRHYMDQNIQAQRKWNVSLSRIALIFHPNFHCSPFLSSTAYAPHALVE